VNTRAIEPFRLRAVLQGILMFGRLADVIVPRRAFSDDDEARRFAEFVRSRPRKLAESTG
jgi:hypothetical protein